MSVLAGEAQYFIPAWKEKIDQAQVHSQRVYLQKRSEADAALKKEREDRQDTALYDVFLKMDTDPAAAKMEYSRLRSEGLFSRASDLINWDSKFNAAAKREASAEEQDLVDPEQFNFSDIGSGKMMVGFVIAGWLPI